MKYLKKGQCLCMRCGSVISLYHNNLFGNKYLAARYQAKPSSPIQFSVFVFGNTIRAADISAHGDITKVRIQLSNPNFHGDFLESFKAKITYQQNNTVRTEENLEVNSEMRVCPYCREIQYLLPHAGHYDAYLIGELGRPGVGKTHFARALSSPRFMVKRDSFLGKGDTFSLLSSPSRGNHRTAASPTALSEREILTFLVHRRHADPVLIYLMDIAGEYTSSDLKREQDRAVFKRILTNYCSAFFVFYDPREIDSDQLREYQKKRASRESEGEDHSQQTSLPPNLRRKPAEYSSRGKSHDQWVDPLSHVREMFDGDMPPIAFLLTGLDTLIDAGKTSQDGWILVNQNKVFSSHSALAKPDNQAPITESSLRERMLLSRAVMQQLGLASEDSGRNEKNGWFVLSSGRVNLDTDEVELESAQGVVEPLAWFLSLAGIARIKEA